MAKTSVTTPAPPPLSNPSAVSRARRFRPHTVFWAILVGLVCVAGYWAEGVWSLQSARAKLEVYQGLLVFAWWASGVLSGCVLASLAALLGWRTWGLVSSRRRVRRFVGPGSKVAPSFREAQSADSSDAEGCSPKPVARSLVRRFVLPIWFTAIVVCVLLEGIGAALVVRPRLTRPPPLPVDLPPSSEDELHLVAIGGSTAEGQPYHTRVSFPQIVGWRLQECFPDVKVRVENLARGGACLGHMREKLRGLRTRPDVLLIYAGHNEFLARYPAEREAGEPFPGFYPPSLLSLAIAGELERVAVALAPQEVHRRLFDRPVATAAEVSGVYGGFRRTMEDILAFCRRHGTLAVVIIPAANESGFEPNRSVLPAGTSPEDQARLQETFDRLTWGRLSVEEEIRLLEEASALAPGLAETWYQLGRRYEAVGRFEEARRAFEQATDCDAFPLRATSEIRQICRQLAGAYGCILLDARDVLRPLSSSGVLGEEVFHDNCHPRLAGYVALADAVLAAMGRPETLLPAKLRRSGAATRAGLATPTSVAEVVSHFQVDQETWVKVCEVEAWVNEYLAAYRFDPTRRLATAQAYREAAERIRGGTPSEQLEVLGIGRVGGRP